MHNTQNRFARDCRGAEGMGWPKTTGRGQVRFYYIVVL